MSFYDDRRGPSSIDLSQDKYTKYKEDVEPCYDEYPYEFNKLVEYQKANFNLTKDTSKYYFMERIRIASVNQMAELKHLISEEVLMNASFLDRLNGYSKLVDLDYDDIPSHYYENMKIEDGILYGDLYANYYYFHIFKDIIRSVPVRLTVETKPYSLKAVRIKYANIDFDKFLNKDIKLFCQKILCLDLDLFKYKLNLNAENYIGLAIDFNNKRIKLYVESAGTGPITKIIHAYLITYSLFPTHFDISGSIKLETYYEYPGYEKYDDNGYFLKTVTQKDKMLLTPIINKLINNIKCRTFENINMPFIIRRDFDVNEKREEKQ